MIRLDLVGKAITEARKKCSMTQEQLAEAVGVSVQAVSKWENGKNLPDIENILLISEATNAPYYILLEAGRSEPLNADIQFRARLFKEENMYTRVKSIASAEKLNETYRALPYMKEQHMGQYRKKAKHTTELVQYINHPLMMACHALALGIRDDAILAAILLHDVVEDTDVNVEDIPFSDEVKELVGLVSFSLNGMQKEEAKTRYYDAIRGNGKACLVKSIDRCNNVSTMAGCYSREKMVEYIDETEKYVLPLIDVLKHGYPEYSDAAFLIKYQIISILETVKNLIVPV